MAPSCLVHVVVSSGLAAASQENGAVACTLPVGNLQRHLCSLTEAEVETALNGGTYLNIHTQTHPDGTCGALRSLPRIVLWLPHVHLRDTFSSHVAVCCGALSLNMLRLLAWVCFRATCDGGVPLAGEIRGQVVVTPNDRGAFRKAGDAGFPFAFFAFIAQVGGCLRKRVWSLL